MYSNCSPRKGTERQTMKIKINERYFEDTNSTTDTWKVDRIEYTPTLEDAKEWAADPNKLVYLADITGTSVDTIERFERKIEKEYLRLLGEDLAKEIVEEGYVEIVHKYFSRPAIEDLNPVHGKLFTEWHSNN